jgi:hypothetical protein
VAFTEHNPTETRPWVKPKEKPRSQVVNVQRQLLSTADGRAFLFALLCDARAFDQHPTPDDFGAQLLTRLIEIDGLGVGSMWAEGMNALHVDRLEITATGKDQATNP